MPASTKKVPAKRRPTAAALDKGVAKVRAANATKAAKAPSLKAVAKATTKALDKPTTVATVETKAPNGAKGKIIAMIARDGGTSAAEVCKALGWVRAGATIGRAIKLAGFKVAKVRDADGVLRYSRMGS